MVKKIYDISKASYDGSDVSHQSFVSSNLDSLVDDDTEFKTRLLIPEEPISDEVLVFAYGMGANSFFHEGEAEEIAKLGYPVALHDEPRYQKRMTVIDLVAGNRSFKSHISHKLNPLIFASQAISSVMRTVEDNYDAEGFIVKGHSKGGLTAAMAGAHEPKIRAIVLDSPAGVVTRNSFVNHMTGGREMLQDEVIPMANMIASSERPNTRERAIRNMLDDPGRMGREILTLIARTPDIRELLAESKTHGSKVAVIGHENDRFFAMSDLDRDVPQMIDDGFVDLYARVSGTKHINPGYDPQFSAKIFDLVIRSLDANI